MIVTLCGKGGVGKTTISAMLLDELARAGYPGPVLAVDGDPASTLAMSLGLPASEVTIADIRDNLQLDAKTKRNLPKGMPPAVYAYKQVQETGALLSYQLRDMPLDLITMGQGEGPGCYCDVNHALSSVLKKLVHRYALILIDNEAGLEHISRYRLERADLFLVVATPNPKARSVAQRIMATAHEVNIAIGESMVIYNQIPPGFHPEQNGYPTMPLTIPHSSTLAEIEMLGKPIDVLPVDDVARQALQPILARIMGISQTCA